MKNPSLYSDADLERLRANERMTIESSQRFVREIETELELRRRDRPVTMPLWVFEVLSAHARKRFQNIASHNRTTTYQRALAHAHRILGREVWPRDIDGEHHGSTPSGY